MAGLVPGGRAPAKSGISSEANEQISETHLLSPAFGKSEKQGSKSLSRIDDVRNQRDKTSDSEKSQTLDRKKKIHVPKLGKSLGNLFQKFARMTNVSLQNTSFSFGGTFKRRSRSADKVEKASDGTSSGSVTPKSAEQYLKKLISENGKPPGLSGICNHGNTCFMNSVLQCLSNTVQFVEYFIAEEYRDDLKKRGKAVAKRNGSKGEVTEALAWLLKSMWTYKYSANASRDFKCVIGKHSLQYQGCAQHDAQEFLLWLIDNVHEELRIEKKKVIKKKEQNDDESAPPPERNSANAESRIYELFQATYRSSLTCSSCHHQSDTYDPFFSLSLPIPQCTTISVTVVVVYLDEHPRQVRVSVMMNTTDTVKDLLSKLTKLSQVPDGQLMLIQTYPNGFARTCQDAESLVDLQAVASADSLCALEMPGDGKVTGDSTVTGDKDTRGTGSDHITLVIVNVDSVTFTDRLKFGGYFVIRVPKNISYKALQVKLIQTMLASTTGKEAPADVEKMEMPFQLRVMGVERDDNLLSADLCMPLYSITISRAVNQYSSTAGPAHVKLQIEWPSGARQRVLPNFTDSVEEHESVKQVQAQGEAGDLFTLDECFQLYTQEEQLVGENAWLCPKCKSRQFGAVKSISLWSLPPVLVVHLKRFRQTGSLRTKVNSLVTFPLRGLNLRRYTVEPTSNGKATASLSPDEWTYDLCGVCNHYGNMFGGHYTACCRNPIDNQWYTFDDSQVTQVSESQTVSRSAYLLFYQRSNVSLSQPQSLVDKVCRLHGLCGADNGKDGFESSSSQGSLPSAQTFLRTSPAYATMPETRRRAHTVPCSGASSPLHAPSLPRASSADALPGAVDAGTLSKCFANGKAESAVPNGTDRLSYFANGGTSVSSKSPKLNGVGEKISGGAASSIPAVKCTLLAISQQAEANKKAAAAAAAKGT